MTTQTVTTTQAIRKYTTISHILLTQLLVYHLTIHHPLHPSYGTTTSCHVLYIYKAGFMLILCNIYLPLFVYNRVQTV